MHLKSYALAAAAGLMGLSGPARADLKVGAARVEQAGPLGPSQTGRYDHEHVFARAIVVEDGSSRAALISFEGPEFGFDMSRTRRAIASRLGCPMDNVVITHTHTHSSTAAPHNMFVKNFRSPGIVSAEIMDAVESARARLQPAKMGYSVGSLALNVNRDGINPTTHKWEERANLAAPSNKAVDVVTFARPDGRPIAAYVTYAMHAVNAFALGVVTADFPGAMSRYVENAFGDDTVIEFSQSASGDQNPLYLRLTAEATASRVGLKTDPLHEDRSAPMIRLMGSQVSAANGGPDAPPADPRAIERLFHLIDAEGQLMGEEVIRVMAETRDYQTTARIAGFQQEVTCPGRARANGGNFDSSREGTAATYVDAAPVDIKVGMLAIGRIAIGSVGGEIYSTIGNRILDRAPMKDTLVVSLANERLPGYIPDDASYGHETFQVLNSIVKPGCAEVAIADAVAAMENRYLAGK